MIDHGLSIRGDKIYLTIPERAGSSFQEVVVNSKRFVPVNNMTNKEAMETIDTLLNVDYSSLTQDQADRLDNALTKAFDLLRYEDASKRVSHADKT